MTDIKQTLWNKSIDLLASTSVFNEGNGVSIDNRVIYVVYDLLIQLDERTEAYKRIVAANTEILAHVKEKFGVEI